MQPRRMYVKKNRMQKNKRIECKSIDDEEKRRAWRSRL